MDILVITQHHRLVESLRTAFQGVGHRLTVMQDALQALAAEAWDRARLVLVDAEGDPMSGYQLCGLLRGESRVLYRNLPVFLILDRPPSGEELALLDAVDGDGFCETFASPERLHAQLGPLLEGSSLRTGGQPLRALARGLGAGARARVDDVVRGFGFDLEAVPARGLNDAILDRRPLLLFLGVDATGDRALRVLRNLPEGHAPYTFLVGGRIPEAAQRRLLNAGAMAWLSLPVSGPLLVHGVRQAMEWLHIRRLKGEVQRQLNELAERRAALEREASSLRSEILLDPLTGLFNRRAFTQNLEHAVHQWERHRRAFVLILGDLDYFKLINDRFGHVAGDQVLQGVGHLLRAGLRRSDLAFRIGGEEFAVLLMETTLEAGAEVAEKIRRRIEAHPCPLPTGPTAFPTMSFGVGAPDARDAAGLFSRVDEALYLAKRRGRNRVEVLEAPAS